MACRTVLKMLARSPDERPTIDELLDIWGPIAQTVGDGATNTSNVFKTR
jgi:hypothetical protein